MFVVAHARTYSIVKVLPKVDLWVMDENTHALREGGGLRDDDLFKINSIPGVEDSCPLYMGKKEFSSLVKKHVNATIIGINKNASFAFPSEFTKGKSQNLTYKTGILTDSVTAKKLSLKLGSRLKTDRINSTVVGIFSYPKRIASTPLIITSLDWAKKLTKSTNAGFPYLLIKKVQGADANAIKKQISHIRNIKAYDQSEFKKMILNSVMKETGLPTAFLSVVICGLILAVGIILSQIFSIIELATEELTLYKTLGGANLKLLGISLFYVLTSILAALFLALVYHFILITLMPSSTFVFPPNGDIVFLVGICSVMTAVFASIIKGQSIKTLGAAII